MSDSYEKFTRGIWMAAGCVLLILAAGGVVLEIDAHRALAPLPATITDARRTVLVLGGASTDLEKTLKIERDAATQQIATANQAAASLAAAGVAVNALLGRTDASLNDPKSGVLPQLSAAIAQANAGAGRLTAQAQINLADLDAAEKQILPGIENFNRASLELAQQMPPILGNVQQITGSTVETAQHVDQTSDYVELSMHDVQQFIHRETTPVRGTWNVLKGFLMEFAGPAAQVATAAK